MSINLKKTIIFLLFLMIPAMFCGAVEAKGEGSINPTYGAVWKLQQNHDSNLLKQYFKIDVNFTQMGPGSLIFHLEREGYTSSITISTWKDSFRIIERSYNKDIDRNTTLFDDKFSGQTIHIEASGGALMVFVDDQNVLTTSRYDGIFNHVWIMESSDVVQGAKRMNPIIRFSEL